MASIFLFLLLVASNEAATGGGCTEGFMDLSLLVAKAATPVYTGSFTAKRAIFLEIPYRIAGIFRLENVPS